MLVYEFLEVLKRNTHLTICRKTKTPGKEIILKKYSGRLTGEEMAFIGGLSIISIEAVEISPYRRWGIDIFVE